MFSVDEILEQIEGKVPKKDAELIKKAYNFAQKAHEGQKRMSGEPYFSHVYETAKILAKLGMDAKTIAAGLLHDVLEDTEITEEEIKKEFEDEIVFLVNGVTKLGTLKYRGHERHVESMRKFFLAMANDLRVVIIKFADRLHNLRTLQYKSPEKQKRIAIESIDVYAPLANRLGMGKLKNELEDAAFPYAFPKEYGMIEDLLKDRKEKYEKDLSEIRKDLEKELEKNEIKFDELSYRIKSKYSLWKKLQRYDMDIEKIHDVIALRVVVDNISDCYKTLGVVHSLWRPVLGRIKDYISLPKPNGYRSLHTTVFAGINGIAEIQIRTKEMHAEAAYGIAAHFAYKENGTKKAKDDQSKFKWVEELKDLNYTPDKPKDYIENLKTDFFYDRIFILTPKGDVVDLPEGSCSIDFAYAIHSEVGEHVLGVRINNNIAPIFSKLKNGDIAEIIVSKNAHPSSKWLEYAKTTVAKKHIKAYLEKNSLLARLQSFGRG